MIQWIAHHFGRRGGSFGRASRGLFFLLGLCGLIGLAVTPLQAVTMQLTDHKEVQGAELETPWEFKLAAPVWLAGVSGEVGVLGHNAQVDVGADTILRKLNFTAAFSAEARKGCFGAYADFLYLDDRAGISRRGLVSKIDLRMDEYLTDFDLEWRVVQGSRGWVDVLAGVRYTNLYTRLGLETDSGRVREASTRLVDATSAAVRHVLDKELGDVLNGQDPVLPVPPLAADQKEKLLKLIRKARANPELVAALLSGDPARIALAKDQVARNIARVLERHLNRDFSLSEDWFDPYVGLRARYDLTKAFYLTVKADVGGFGVGSKITSQAYGALGCQITRNFYAEAGYRYLYVDYDQNGFLYNTSTGGAQITAGVNF